MWGEHVVSYYDTNKNVEIPYSAYVPYKQKFNDYESAAISCEYFKYLSDCKKWTTIKSISNFLDKSSSTAVAFIDNKYKEELDYGVQFIKEHHLSTGKNNFNFNKICNSCLGWLVEFYAKYLIFGRDFLFDEIKEAQGEAKTDEENQSIIFYACYLKYKHIMINTFGSVIAKFIKGPSISDYIKEDYKEFVNTVIALAKRTQDFLINQLHLQFRKDGLLFDEKLSIKNITGKADFITEDTIVDLKTTNNITKRYIRQVLFYHYLSTKRSDLNVKRVIVYDCVSNSYVEIPINVKNYTDYYNPISKLDDSNLPTIAREELNDKILLQSVDKKKLLSQWAKYGKFRWGENKVFFINGEIDTKTDKQKQAEMLLLKYASENSKCVLWDRILNDFRFERGFKEIYKSADSVRDLIQKHINVNKGKEFLINILLLYPEKDNGTLQSQWINYLWIYAPLIRFEDKIYYVCDSNVDELIVCSKLNEEKLTGSVYYNQYETYLHRQLPKQYKQLANEFIDKETLEWCETICREINPDSYLADGQIESYIYTPIYNAIKQEFNNSNRSIIINKRYIGIILKAIINKLPKNNKRMLKQFKKIRQLKSLILEWAENLI